MNIEYTIFPLSDDAVVLHLGQDVTKLTNRLLQNVEKRIVENPFPGFLESENSFTTLTIYYEKELVPVENSFQYISEIIKQYINEYAILNQTNKVVIEIPVCYHPQLAPDLTQIASYNEVTIPELIEIHSNETYFVSYIGFGGTIPFLGGVNEKLPAPRKKSSSINIPYGAVGITGSKTGIYPIGTTVGWQIIGRAPANVLKNLSHLFDLNNEIRFKPITLEEYYYLEKYDATMLDHHLTYAR